MLDRLDGIPLVKESGQHGVDTGAFARVVIPAPPSSPSLRS
jgi:hypothetical protein